MRKDLWCRNCGSEDTLPQNKIMFCDNCSSAYRAGFNSCSEKFDQLYRLRMIENLAKIWGVN